MWVLEIYKCNARSINNFRLVIIVSKPPPPSRNRTTHPHPHPHLHPQIAENAKIFSILNFCVLFWNFRFSNCECALRWEISIHPHVWIGPTCKCWLKIRQNKKKHTHTHVDTNTCSSANTTPTTLPRRIDRIRNRLNVFSRHPSLCVCVCECVSNFCLPCARRRLLRLSEIMKKKNQIIFKDIQNFPFGEMCIHVLQMCLSNTCVYL